MTQQGYLTDVEGIRVGHDQNREAVTGCTVVLFEFGACAAAVVRGFASSVRQFGALELLHSVPRIDGLVLAGGSAFGLGCSTGAMRYLAEVGRGFPTAAALVPIVPTAILYDLNIGSPSSYPTEQMAYAACSGASDGPFAIGSVGAGTGATSGKVLGVDNATKGGLGTASTRTPEGAVVAALAVVNAFGDVVKQGRILAGARDPASPQQFVDSAAWLRRHGRTGEGTGENTTLVVVATDAELSKIELGRLAAVAANALPQTIRPVHTPYDGDLLVSVSTGASQAQPDLLRLGLLAEQLVMEAVWAAVTSARSLGGVPALSDLTG